MAESVDRDLGRLEGRTESIEHRLENIEANMQKVLETLQHAKGGWRMLMVVGGVCAAVGSVITGIWSTLAGRR